MLEVVVFVVLELTFVIWYLSVAAVRRLVYSLTTANPFAMLAIRHTIETYAKHSAGAKAF